MQYESFAIDICHAVGEPKVESYEVGWKNLAQQFSAGYSAVGTPECLHMILCRPYGTQLYFALYPGLTPGANANSAPVGLVLVHSLYVAN